MFVWFVQTKPFHDVYSHRDCVCVVCAVRGIVYVRLCGVYRQENLIS